jgi:hypothetical protein
MSLACDDLNPYVHVEGTPYTCPKCVVKTVPPGEDVGGQELRIALLYKEADIFVCPVCETCFTGMVLAKIQGETDWERISNLCHPSYSLCMAVETYLEQRERQKERKNG